MVVETEKGVLSKDDHSEYRVTLEITNPYKAPISTRVYERAGMVGWAVILVVFVFALQNDIGKIFGSGFTFK